MTTYIQQRLDYLRTELRAERISTAELLELQSLAEYIAPDDVELLEAAGVPEFPDEVTDTDRAEIARLITGGNTSGILDGEGYRITWELKMDKFTN
jgi:hypothetical protein